MVNDQVQELPPTDLVEGEGVVQDVTDDYVGLDLHGLAQIGEALLGIGAILGLSELHHEVANLSSDLISRLGLAVVLFKVESNDVLFIHGYFPIHDPLVVLVLIFVDFVLICIIFIRRVLLFA